jgi:isopenicillin-N epimerase
MAANRALALAGRDIIAEALGNEPAAPDSMLGSMAALPLAGVAPEAAAALHDELVREESIQVPIVVWPVPAARDGSVAPSVLLRISAQRYNEPVDYARLAAALQRRLPCG